MTLDIEKCRLCGGRIGLEPTGLIVCDNCGRSWNHVAAVVAKANARKQALRDEAEHAEPEVVL